MMSLHNYYSMPCITFWECFIIIILSLLKKTLKIMCLSSLLVISSSMGIDDTNIYNYNHYNYDDNYYNKYNLHFAKYLWIF